MKVGFSEADITPSHGMERPGGVNRVFLRGVSDPCLASACVIDDGERVVAIVGLDALSVKRSTVVEARRIITEATGIPAEHVMVGASHTHSGGPLAAAAFGSTPDEVYVGHVTRQIATAVIDAHRRAEVLQIGVGAGEARGAAFPRRWQMRDGTVQSHPGTRNPEEMDRPQGPVDSSVGVIGAFDAEGTPRGCVVNFACHATTGLGVDATASADWIHFLRGTLRAVFGEQFGVVFVNGACGDLTQVDNTDPGPHWSGPLNARRVGMTVAGEALKVLSQMSFRDQVDVAGRNSLIQLAHREVSDEMLAWAEAHQDSDQMVKGRWFPDRVWAQEWIALARLNAKEPEIEAEIQALRIGRAALVSNPTECFCSLGLDIKRRSKFEPTFVVSLANGCVGYVGTRDSYAEDYIPREGVPMNGGFETVPALSSKCAPGSGETLVDASVELLNSLMD
jgi:hypothetical protein